MKRALVLLIGITLLGVPAFSQTLTGTIVGKTTMDDGALPGVTVTATSPVLPQPRIAVTSGSGDYRLVALPPGEYVVSFEMDGMDTQERTVRVQLEQTHTVNVVMGVEALAETLLVVGTSALIDTNSTEIKSAISNDVIQQLPVAQEYRDLIKLIPGVQYSEDSVRGPSAGGSGQDNVYKFDGANVGRPLFGSLSAEPSSHDIDQISVVRGGAKAIDFNRSGGFTINSVSKSGTNKFHGAASYQIQTEGMTGSLDTESESEFKENQDWTVLSIGGPIVADQLLFYTSYYRPTTDRNTRSNLYGEVPDANTTRDEFFGKLTWTPTGSLLFGGSYRDSSAEGSGLGAVLDTTAGTATSGSTTDLKIAILEGSWIVNDRSFFSFKYTDFSEENAGLPDNLFDFNIGPGVNLDVNNLDQVGLFRVPQPIDGNDEFNQFIAPIIDTYGYLENGVRNGGGIVGGASTVNDQDFFREGFEVAYDRIVGRHDLHFGYNYTKDEEDLSRTSNGWGVVSVIGGRDTTADGTPIFYEGRFEQQTLSDVAPINSQFESQSFEINDTIKLDNWSINVGFLISEDKLFGQGLKENSSNVSGFELAPGNKYLMKKVGFDEMIQPRLGATWNKNGKDTVFASFARYYPAASSLPRAASWARNNRRSIRAFFDADGNFLTVDPVRSSSGKFFQEGIDPRKIDEFIVGYSRQINPRWTGKAHVRYRSGRNFWEDTNNTARLRFEAPDDVPKELYIPELDEYRAEVGGSSYVIAELDNSYTEYYEANLEADWRGRNAYFSGTYVWSHYYGNFDQDNSTTSNDADTFIGSSFIADGAGRQLWNFRDGNLRGDRRHQLKGFGYYNFDWNGSAGAFVVYQSGQPWETWDVEVYRHLTGSSSDTSRYAEPAGSNTTGSHFQVDLNYTQNFGFGGERYNVQLRADIYNLLDNQTGYNIQNKKNSANFGDARDFFNPQRLQLAVKFEF